MAPRHQYFFLTVQQMLVFQRGQVASQITGLQDLYLKDTSWKVAGGAECIWTMGNGHLMGKERPRAGWPQGAQFKGVLAQKVYS